MGEPVLDAARTFVGVREIRRQFPLTDEVSEALAYAFRDAAPQALLRDLHRPVLKFEVSITEFERVEVPRDAGRDAYAVVKARILNDYRVPIQQLLSTNGDAYRAMRELKLLLARPWSEAPRIGTRYTSARGRLGS